jgi:hypothetical protein
MTEEQERALRALAEELRPVVEAIEGGPETTQGRYDQYMAVLARLGKGQSDTTVMAIAVAMMQAGANRPGVVGAMKAMGYV